MFVFERRGLVRALSAAGLLAACAPLERAPVGGAPVEAVSEQALIVAYLGRLGVAPGDVRFGGRRVFLQQDAFLYADDLLASAGSVDKGRVPTSLAPNSGFSGCGVDVCGALAPVQFAAPIEPDAGGAADGGDAGGVGAKASLRFWRPDTTRAYFLVVDDAAPEFFTRTPPSADAGVIHEAATLSNAGDAGIGSDAGQEARSLAASGIIGAAAAQIVDASASDCLAPGLFRVLRSQEYLALPAAERDAGYRIDVGGSGFFEMCSGAAVACANLPRLAGSANGGGEAPRLRFGDRIDIVDTALVQPTTAVVEFGAYGIGVAAHELLHTLGFGHVLPQLLGDVVVPGTAAGDGQLSIMHSSGSHPNFRSTLQADDVLTLSKLYGGECEYREQARLIQP